MKITPVCGNTYYSIRFVEFIKRDGSLAEAYFELINHPFKCVGIFSTVEDAKAEMQRLTLLQQKTSPHDAHQPEPVCHNMSMKNFAHDCLVNSDLATNNLAKSID